MSPPTPPRRITRGSLARYAYQASEKYVASSPVEYDIEDAIPSTSRKRKRNLLPISPLPSRPKRTRKTDAKKDVKSESETDSPAATSSRTGRSMRIKTNIASEYFTNTSSSRTRGTRTTTEVNYAEDEGEDQDNQEDASESAPIPAKARRTRKPARRIKDQYGEIKMEPPSNWLKMYELVKQMRLDDGPAAKAPVDTMGCERLAERDSTPRDRRFQTLIALMLSSQTKDTVNAVAMKRLQTELEPHAPGAKRGLNLENILKVDPVRLNELIGLVGFHNNKTKYIKQAAVILRDKFGHDIPDTIEGLVSLPGVGPKMAHLCLSAAWDRTEGIGVDVHVHRIANLWGWIKTKTPEETRLSLQSWLPRDKWREINWLLVGFGQMVCVPIGRKCGKCELGHQGLCKAADQKKVNDAKAVRDQMFKAENDIGTENDGPVIKKEEKNVVLALVEQESVIHQHFDKSLSTLCTTDQGPEVMDDAVKQETPDEIACLPSRQFVMREEVIKKEDAGVPVHDIAIATIEMPNIVKSDPVEEEDGAVKDFNLVKRENTGLSQFVKRESMVQEPFVKQETSEIESVPKWVKQEPENEAIKAKIKMEGELL